MGVADIILPNQPKGVNRFVAYLYGLDTGMREGRAAVLYYRVWQMFPPNMLIPKGFYGELAQKELKHFDIAMWHFCVEVKDKDIEMIFKRRAGICRTYTFALEEVEGRGWEVRASLNPKQHIQVLLAKIQQRCDRPGKARIFKSFRSLRTFEG